MGKRLERIEGVKDGEVVASSSSSLLGSKEFTFTLQKVIKSFHACTTKKDSLVSRPSSLTGIISHEEKGKYCFTVFFVRDYTSERGGRPGNEALRKMLFFFLFFLEIKNPVFMFTFTFQPASCPLTIAICT